MSYITEIVAGGANQFKITQPDSTSYAIGLSDTIVFPLSVTVIGDLAIQAAIQTTGSSLLNPFANLSYPSGTPSFLSVSQGSSSTSPGVFSWEAVYPSTSITLSFSYNGTGRPVSTTGICNLYANQAVLTIDLSNLNPSSSPLGLACDVTSNFFQATLSESFIIPSSLNSGGYLFIGHLPIQDTTTGVNVYWLGNVYLYNNGTNIQILITLGHEVGASGAPQFVSGHTYSFGYINQEFWYFIPDGRNITIPTTLQSTFSYLVS